MSFRPPLWIPDGRPIMLGHTNGECHSCASIAAQTRFWTRRATDPTVGGDLFQLTEGGKLGLGVDDFTVYDNGTLQKIAQFRYLVSVAKGVFYSKQSHFTAKFKAFRPELVALRGAEIVAGVGTRHFHAGRFC